MAMETGELLRQVLFEASHETVRQRKCTCMRNAFDDEIF